MPSRRLLLSFAAAPLLARAARAAEIADATGRMVALPERVRRVLPLDLASAVLLATVAPDLLPGWPTKLPEAARALLADHPASLPELPEAADPVALAALLKPDAVLRYGSVGAAEVSAMRELAGRLAAPALLLNDDLRETPHALRVLGAALHREERAETLARLAEAMLAMAPPGGGDTRAMLLRGAGPWQAAAPGTGAAGVFAILGWSALAPAGTGEWRPVTPAEAARLDPDLVVFESQAMRDPAKLAPWAGLRALRAGRAFAAPALPFGWIADPVSCNRLLGVAWLAGADPVTASALFGAVAYGRAPDPAQLAALRRALRPLSV